MLRGGCKCKDGGEVVWLPQQEDIATNCTAAASLLRPSTSSPTAQAPNLAEKLQVCCGSPDARPQLGAHSAQVPAISQSAPQAAALSAGHLCSDPSSK